MDMFSTKTAKYGAVVAIAGILAGLEQLGYGPGLMEQLTDLKAADLVMLGVGLIFGRDMMQKLIMK